MSNAETLHLFLEKAKMMVGRRSSFLRMPRSLPSWVRSLFRFLPLENFCCWWALCGALCGAHGRADGRSHARTVARTDARTDPWADAGANKGTERCAVSRADRTEERMLCSGA